jgi:hypothetical protein
MVTLVLNQKLKSWKPEQLQAFSNDLEDFLDGIADRNFARVGELLEQYHMQEGGIVETIVLRMMGVSADAPETEITDDELNAVHD